MRVPELLAWQWNGYERNHQNRTNLLVHIAFVPLFLIGTLGLVASLAMLSPLIAAVSIVALVVSLAAQGKGHRCEPHPPEPFTGPGNAIARIVLEQWITFPRFVLSGGWSRAFRGARASGGA
ncbi:MAG: terminase [Thermoanaerobaculia bacterium]